MAKLIKILKSLLREFTRTFMGVTMLLVSGIVLVLISDVTDEVKMSQKMEQDGWGSEALLEVYEGLATISPIALANACGLGASSCFKCHNGKRAKSANMNSKEAPWHSDHAKVNNSCVGCHKGNPRLMKKQMSHRRLLDKVLTNLETACSKCHSDDSDLKQLAKNYVSIGGNNQ